MHANRKTNDSSQVSAALSGSGRGGAGGGGGGGAARPSITPKVGTGQSGKPHTDPKAATYVAGIENINITASASVGCCNIVCCVAVVCGLMGCIEQTKSRFRCLWGWDSNAIT